MARTLRWAPLWVVVAACIAYGNMVPGAFHPDDVQLVQQNVGHGSLDAIPRFFADASTFTDVAGDHDYRPLMLTGFAVLYRIGGLDPLPFHVWSLILHALVALVLFYLVRSLLLWTDSDELGVATRAEATLAAWLAASLFAVHTLTWEAVSGVSGQAVLLMTLFYVLAVLAYARLVEAVEAGAGAGRLWLLGAAAVLAQGSALLSKSTAITLPVVLLLYDLLFAAPSRRASRAWRERAARLAPFVAVNIVWLLLRPWMTAASGGGPAPRGWLANFLTESHAIAFYYLRRVLWPHPLSVRPSFPVAVGWGEPAVLAALGVLLALLVAVLLTWRRYRLAALGAGWLLITLLPVTYLNPVSQIVSEHRMYLPLAGLMLPLALLATAPLVRSESRALRRGSGLAIAAVLVALAGHTVLQNRGWESGLAAPAVERGAEPGAAPAVGTGQAPPAPAAAGAPPRRSRPDSLFALAYARQAAGDADAAAAAYGELLAADPDHVQGLFNLSYALIRAGGREQLGRAVILLERALDLRPGYTEILFRLGEAHARRAVLPGGGPGSAAGAASAAHDRRRAAAYFERYLAAPGGSPQLRERAAQELAALRPAPD